jgi:hypothetical protein
MKARQLPGQVEAEGQDPADGEQPGEPGEVGLAVLSDPRVSVVRAAGQHFPGSCNGDATEPDRATATGSNRHLIVTPVRRSAA